MVILEAKIVQLFFCVMEQVDEISLQRKIIHVDSLQVVMLHMKHNACCIFICLSFAESTNQRSIFLDTSSVHLLCMLLLTMGMRLKAMCKGCSPTAAVHN